MQADEHLERGRGRSAGGFHARQAECAVKRCAFRAREFDLERSARVGRLVHQQVGDADSEHGRDIL